MRSVLTVGVILVLVGARPVAAQTRSVANVSSAGGVPALNAELAAETAARVNADATEMANRTNADMVLQEQITQLQAALAGQQGGARRIVGTLQLESPNAAFPIYGFAIGASVAVSTAGGGAAGRAQLKDATFTKAADAASPTLFETLVTGKHVRKATFTMPASSQPGRLPPPPYRVITLEDLLFANVDMGALEALESYSMAYVKICIKYVSANGTSTETCATTAI